MPDLDPIKAQAILDISSMQSGFDQLAQAVQQATDKIKQALEDAGTKSKKHLQDVEHETENLGDAFKKLGTNIYENIHTPFGEIHERMLPFLEDLSGGVLLLGAFAAAAAVVGGELLHMADEFADNARAIETQSKMYGISTEQLQVFRDESERLGMGTEAASFGLRALTRVFTQTGDTMDGLGMNTGRANDIMRQYGITGDTVQEKMMSLLDAIRKTSDEGERQAIVLGLVGTRGLMLLPILEDLADRGYNNVKEEMKDVGVLLDQQSIQAGVTAHDAVFNLKEAWEGLKIQLEESAVPALTHIANGLAKAIEFTREFSAAIEKANAASANRGGDLPGKKPETEDEKSPLPKPETIQTRARALIDEIAEADKEGIKHKETLLKHRQAIEEFAKEMGEHAPIEIKKFANQLKEINESIAKSGEGEIKKAYAEQEKLGKENVKENRDLQKENEKYINDSFKRTTEENAKELEKRTKDVLKYIKTTHELAQEDVDNDYALGKIKLKGEEDNVTFLENTHKISFDKAIQMKKDLAKEELKIETDKIQAQIKIDELSPDSEVKVKQLKDKLVQIQKEYNLKIEHLDDESITNRSKKWDNFINQIRTGMDTAINGWLQGTQSFTQAWVKMLDSMLVTFAKQLEKMLLDWITFHDQKKTVSLATELKQITHTAASAAAHAYDAVVGIPIVGPVLAPPAAVVAFAAVEAFGALASAAGGMLVPNDMLAMIHKDERVLPAKYSQGLDALVNNGGGHTHFHFAPQVQAMDAEGVDRVLTKHRRRFVQEMQTAKRNGQI